MSKIPPFNAPTVMKTTANQEYCMDTLYT